MAVEVHAWEWIAEMLLSCQRVPSACQPSTRVVLSLYLLAKEFSKHTVKAKDLLANSPAPSGSTESAKTSPNGSATVEVDGKLLLTATST